MTHKVLIPGALQKPIPQTASDPDIIPVGAVFHVAVSEAESLHDFFSGPSGGVESHGYIRRDGTIEQYRPLTVECDAQFDGNSWVAKGMRFGLTSWETQGMGSGEWTPQQVASIQKIINFLRDEWGVPSRQCPTPTSPGFGYHALFTAWNHNAHSCPGPDRIAQWKRVILPWIVTPPPTDPTRYKRVKVGHSRKGQPEYKGDSYRGILDAVKRKCKAIDFNLMLTKDDVLAVQHWPKPLRHGFRDPESLLSKDTLFSAMTWGEVARLRTADRPPYTIHKAEELTNAAANHDLDTEAELKVLVPTSRLKIYLAGVHHPDRVIFKALYKRSEKTWLRLKEAHATGRPTLLLCHHPFCVVPAEARAYIDHYRGFKPRFK